MNFHIVNLSKRKDEIIRKWLINYWQYLKNNGIEFEVNINFLKNQFVTEVLLLNDLVEQTGYELNHLISYGIQNPKFSLGNVLDIYQFKALESLNLDVVNCSKKDKVIAIGELLKTKGLWGIASIGNLVAVISHVEEKVLWHEVSHILGVDDHYQNDNDHSFNVKHPPKEKCSLDGCVMRWGEQQKVLCHEALSDVKEYFNM